MQIFKNAIRYRAFKGSGKGGQHRNVTMSDIEATLDPSVAEQLGIPPLSARASGRDQHRNKRNAAKILKSRIAAALKEQRAKDRFAAGFERVRNYHEPDDRVTDGHGNQWSFRATVGRGDLSECIESRRDAVLTESESDKGSHP